MYKLSPPQQQQDRWSRVNRLYLAEAGKKQYCPHERRFKNVWSYFTYSFDHHKDDVFWHWIQNAGVDDIHVTVGQIANELGFALSAHILSCTLMNQTWKSQKKK